MDIYWLMFFVLVVICGFLYVYTRQVVQITEDASFKSFQRVYLLVYLLAMGGDWLQGPYVYALYQHYGMTSHQIDILFVAGFGSSMIFGSIVGSSADKFGRRSNCILYAILYSLSCVTKHYANFTILLIGRFLGGIATSILFSAFESWMICEHQKRGFSQELLGVLFSRATLGNSLVAISAGHLAQAFADMYSYVAPFDLSMAVLFIMLVCTILLWNENYGDSSGQFFSNMTNAAKVIKEDRNVLLLGLIQAFFEGSMYTFVLKWTPALTPDSTAGESQSIPHGVIFASFMVAVMIGSFLFKLLGKIAPIESYMRFVFLTAAVSLLIPTFVPDGSSCTLLSFCLFEVCVGIFWPALGTLRGAYVPEAVRSSVMNIFRIPLNLIVIVVLLQDWSNNVVFYFCVLFLSISSLSQHMLFRYTDNPGKDAGGFIDGDIKQTEQSVA